MSSQPALGDVLLDRYELVEEIGRGGFGIVYRAKQLGMNRDVAIKLLHQKGDEEMRERFRREALMARNLNHPHTIRQYDFGETDDGLLYLVLEYLDGVNLVEAIAEQGAFGDDRVRHIAEGVLKSLGEAHAQGIVHRDLKPANIMICNVFGEKDYPKVLDFGIAKTVHGNTDLTQAGVALGSPKYMAPEVLQGLQPTPAADVYTIAITLSEAIIGRPLIEAGNSVEAARLQLSPDPLPVPDDLRNSALFPWLSVALQKDPAKRFQNASQMLDHLHASPQQLASRGADVNLSDVAVSDDELATNQFKAAPDVDPHGETAVGTTQESSNGGQAVPKQGVQTERDDPDQYAATQALEAVPGPADPSGAGLAIGSYAEGDEPTEMISLSDFEAEMGKAPTAEANPALTPTAEANRAVPPADAPTERHEAVPDSMVGAQPGSSDSDQQPVAGSESDRQQAGFQSQPPGGLGMVPGIGVNAPDAEGDPNAATGAATGSGGGSGGGDEDSTEFVDVSSLAPTISADEKKSQKTLFLALGGVVLIGLIALGGLAGVLYFLSGDKEESGPDSPAAVADDSTTDEKVAVKIFSSPRGAAVIIDGQEKAKTPAHFRIRTRDLPKTVELEQPGYKTASVEITADGKSVFDVKLESSVKMFDKKSSDAKPADEKPADEKSGAKSVEEKDEKKPRPERPSRPKKPSKPKDDNPVDIW